MKTDPKYYISRVGLSLARIGMELEHQGGGLWNWRKDIGNGLELFCCDTDGMPPDDETPVIFGVMLTCSDSITDKTYETGNALADFLLAAEVKAAT